MNDSIKSVLMFVAIFTAMEVLKRLFGWGVSLTVAVAALSFCIGALWGAGREIEKSRQGE